VQLVHHFLKHSKHVFFLDLRLSPQYGAHRLGVTWLRDALYGYVVVTF
jgi:hypothetical protein